MKVRPSGAAERVDTFIPAGTPGSGRGTTTPDSAEISKIRGDGGMNAKIVLPVLSQPKGRATVGVHSSSFVGSAASTTHRPWWLVLRTTRFPSGDTFGEYTHCSAPSGMNVRVP